MSAWSDRVRWGVIDDARRRQRRQRLAAAMVLLACSLAAILLANPPGAPHRAPPLRLSSSLTWLAGPTLGPTHLRLVAAEGDDPPAIIDVDSGVVTALPQLNVPIQPNLGPDLLLAPMPGGALAVVNHQACQHCALTEDDFLIGANGSVRRVAARHFPAFVGTIERIRVPGSTAEWVLMWPHRGPCTLRLLPSSRPAVHVPCGDVGGTYLNDVELWTHRDQDGLLVDPRTGAVLRRLDATSSIQPVGHGFAVEGPPAGHGDLHLVNLATGARRDLGWPSRLQFGYQLLPDPAGPFVAIEFGDPAYPGYSIHANAGGTTIGQALDLWLLDTRSGRLTHLPGFPILELLKQSGVAWTADGRLVIAARGGSFSQSTTRTVIGVWRPGERAVPVAPLPPLNGYTQLVPLVD